MRGAISVDASSLRAEGGCATHLGPGGRWCGARTVEETGGDLVAEHKGVERATRLLDLHSHLFTRDYDRHGGAAD